MVDAFDDLQRENARVSNGQSICCIDVDCSPFVRSDGEWFNPRSDCTVDQRECNDIIEESPSSNAAHHRSSSKIDMLIQQGIRSLIYRRCKGVRRVNANEVTQDYITNRQHIHTNGKRWYVTHIDRDAEVISKEEQVQKLKKMEEGERRMGSQRIQRIIEQNQRMKIKDDDQM